MSVNKQQIDIFVGDPLLNLAERLFLRGHAYRAPVICILLYYGLPLCTILLEVLLTKWICQSKISPNVSLRRYFFDLTHINFTIVAAGVGSYLIYKYWKFIPVALQKVQSDRVIHVNEHQFKVILSVMQKKINSWRLHLVAIISFVLCYTTFGYIAIVLRPVLWWGNIKYSYSGLVLAAMISAVLYYAVYGFGIILITTSTIKEILKHGIKYAPLHIDNFFGLQPFVSLITFKFTLMLMGGIALFSTYYLGYFGLEKTLLMYAAIATYIVGSFIIILRPLRIVMGAIRQVRDNELVRLREEIENRIHELRTKETNSAKEASYLIALQNYFHYCLDKGLFPYPKEVLTAGVGAFVVQGILLIKELYCYIRA